ncbi:hypothetical protein BJY01DRAFT_254915 [Aspergillus pseudoustus]|uniref:Carboxymuconolactone decarboxylase-like domain-containing protein n=1 Tax=Aspergillus pseudoustus TaxID=1810923 RepID=A0ABR4IPD2_9EURO
MATFEEKYLTANNAPNAPRWDSELFEGLRSQLVSAAPELKPIEDAILAALCIGAHRADLVPCILEDSLRTGMCATADAFYKLEGVIMIVWPFVGIPWCVTACLGVAEILRRHDLLDLTTQTPRRPEINGDDHGKAGEELMERTYQNVANSEVREILRQHFSDFSSLTWAVCFGYSLGETTRTGVFLERESQLILASAITSSGASRQAASHLRAARGLGNSSQAIRAVWNVAKKLCLWNNVHLAEIPIEDIAH